MLNKYMYLKLYNIVYILNIFSFKQLIVID